MATKRTCLVSQCRTRAFSALALALLGACGDPPTQVGASPALTDGAVPIADASGALTGGATAGGGLTGGGMIAGSTGGTTGGALGGGLAGGGTTGGGSGGADAGLVVLGPDAGGGVAGSGGFPRSSDAVNVTATGPYMVDKYDGPASPVFDSSRIYYPTNASPPFAIMALSPGFTNVKEDFLWWGPVLASHGFVVAILSPTTSLDFPAERADDLEAGIALLRAENTRSASPLLGKLDVGRAGLLGHSMGGGAALLVAARASSRYQAAVAWEPWESLQTGGIRIPTLILAGELDLVAGANDMAWPFYQAIPSTTTKAYAEFAGLGHNTANSLGSTAERELHAKWTIAWMKVHLENDVRYDTFIRNGAELARFARAPSTQ
jgi:hypothetical protein